MIKGISDIRRLPRLGKIRLGEKRKGDSGEYPAALDHFNFKDTPEVAKVYGDKCTELDIMLPHENPNVFFSQGLRAWRKSGIFCFCLNGETATRVRLGVSDGKFTKVPAGKEFDPRGEAYIKEMGLDVDIGDMYELPCLNKECSFLNAEKPMCAGTAILMVFLPKVPGFGCYQIDSKSVNMMIDINSYLEPLRSAAGHISMIPLKLKLVAKQSQVKGKPKTIHYLVIRYEAGSLSDLMAMRTKTLPEPLGQLPPMTELQRETADDMAPEGGVALDRALMPPPDKTPPKADDLARVKAAFAPKPKAEPPAAAPAKPAPAKPATQLEVPF